MSTKRMLMVRGSEESRLDVNFKSKFPLKDNSTGLLLSQITRGINDTYWMVDEMDCWSANFLPNTQSGTPSHTQHNTHTYTMVQSVHRTLMSCSDGGEYWWEVAMCSYGEVTVYYQDHLPCCVWHHWVVFVLLWYLCTELVGLLGLACWLWWTWWIQLQFLDICP